MVGEQGTVVQEASRRALVVDTTRERHVQIGSALQQLAAPPPNIRIQVQFRDPTGTAGEARQWQARAQGGQSAGRTRTAVGVGPVVQAQTASGLMANSVRGGEAAPPAKAVKLALSQ